MKLNFPENIANKRDSIMPLSKQTLWKETKSDQNFKIVVILTKYPQSSLSENDIKTS